MSWVTKCPSCEEVTEHTELGVVHGRHLYQCRAKKCEILWEKVTIKKIIGAKDPVRKILL